MLRHVILLSLVATLAACLASPLNPMALGPLVWMTSTPAPVLVRVVTVVSPPTATPVPTSAMAGEPTVTPPPPKVDVAPRPPLSPSRVEEGTFFSESLGRTMPYFAYVPPGYDGEPGLRYPVLYMLHGIGGQNTEWINLGLLTSADEMINSGEIPPFLIVLPQGDQSYWLDHADGGPKWGTYTAQDVVREIDNTYRTLPDSQHRAIGGLSMGAHGALQLAINFPGVFSIVGAHSPTLRRRSELAAYFGDEAYFNAHDPVHLYQDHADIARGLLVWLDDGLDDPLGPSIEAFQQQLERDGIPNILRRYPGDHSWDYWGGHVPYYLRFYASALYLSEDSLSEEARP
ncbi:MAG: hypothetical protein KIT87_00090 [Anaerolineae bacterium]|nr:hypothetical protein [Anaerolineae bacterium]